MKQRVTRNKQRPPGTDKPDGTFRERFHGLLSMAKIALFLSVLTLFCLILFKMTQVFFQPIGEVRYRGNDILSRTDILEQLHIPDNTPFYAIDPYVLTRRLAAIPWVQKAQVRKQFPSILDILIKERLPVAYLRTSRGFYFLDEQGVVLDLKPYPFKKDFIVIEDLTLTDLSPGEKLTNNALQHAFTLIQMLKKSEVLPLEAVSEIIISDPLNIQLTTVSGPFLLKFGVDHFQNKLNNLEQALPEIYKRRNRIQSLDLRYKNKIAASLKTETN